MRRFFGFHRFFTFSTLFAVFGILPKAVFLNANRIFLKVESNLSRREVMKMLGSLLAQIIYALRGWSFEPLPDYWASKQVIIGFPHRSNMDTVMAFAGFLRVGVKGHVLIKDTWFFWPMSLLIRALGGIPVNRNAAGGVVGQMVKEFAERESFILALVPEGSRRGVARLKTGFWHIARGAKVPIVCWYLDPINKQTRWVGRLETSESLEHDLQVIRQLYADAGFEIPPDSPPEAEKIPA